MTDEEIVEMAHELYRREDESWREFGFAITFARLIQQKQREIDAALCDRRLYATDCAVAIRSQKP
jgi:hypothetical protein